MKISSLLIDTAKLIGAVGTIATGALWLDSKFDNTSDSIEYLQETVEYISVEQSLMSADLEALKDTSKDISEEISEMSRSHDQDINSITWMLRNWTKYTEEQLNDLMDEMLKKNDLISDQTP